MTTTSDLAPPGSGPHEPGIALDAERSVRAATAAARQEVIGALSQLGFKVTSQQLTIIEAHRGSAVSGAFSPRRTPMSVTVLLDPVADGCHVRIHAQARTSSLTGNPAGIQPVVLSLLSEVLQSIDAGLASLDQPGATAFDRPAFSGVTGPIAATSFGPAAAIPGPAASDLPEAWHEHEGVLLAAPEHVAFLTLAEAQAHLAVAAMVGGQPGSLPPRLARELELLAVRIEHALAESSAPLVRIDLTAEERPAIDFMHQQVRIRSRLPVRTLQRCRDCRFEKITNPDLEHLLQRNKRLRSLTSAFGATVFRGGISPFVLVGTLFQLKRLDPDYVCPRCQGVSADGTMVTFCPGCGELCRDAVLRTCDRCSHDFRAGLEPESFWVDPPEVAAAAIPVGTPPLGFRGAVCRTCGREFTSLWRIVVLSPSGGLEEWFVCASSPTCAPPSLTAPVIVAGARATWGPPHPPTAT